MNTNSFNQDINFILIPESQLCFDTDSQKVCISVTQVNPSNLEQTNYSISTQGIIGKGIGYGVGGLLGGLATLAVGTNPFKDSSIVKLASNKGSDIGDYFIPF